MCESCADDELKAMAMSHGAYSRREMAEVASLRDAIAKLERSRRIKRCLPWVFVLGIRRSFWRRSVP